MKGPHPTSQIIMHNKILLLLALFALSLTLSANEGDSLRFDSRFTPKMSWETTKDLDNYLQYGFHIGTDIPLDSRYLSGYDHLNGILAGSFGFYARGGYKFIFGEVGLGYMFYKGRYEARNTTSNILIGTETVESRYLQIPVKVVGNIGLGKECFLLPNTGFVYQPLIHCTKNDISYGKDNLMRHQFLYHAGLAFRVKFFTVELAYKKSLRPFFTDRTSIKQSYFSIYLGVKL